MTDTSILVNGRHYDVPKVPAVVICIDGCEPAYLDEAISSGLMPNLQRLRDSGSWQLARSAIPSFTNPNNLSIATGAPPAIHGISGNTFLDRETGDEVMMNDVSFLRAGTIFKAFQDHGAKVAVVTAKDKLRALLGAGLKLGSGKAVCFSAEKAEDTTLEANGLEAAASWLGMPQPDVYSADLSEFVFAAGVKLLKEWRPDLMYLTTTDFIQHKYAPGETVANEFHAMIDKHVGELDKLGAVIVLTADHGMKAKHGSDGSAQVCYVQDLLDDWLGAGKTRVILPITDPYVVHHGSLGSYATAYLDASCDLSETIARLREIPELELVLSGDDAAGQFDLPRDRIGDIVLLSNSDTAIGSSRERHDLGALDRPLRSHGGLSEQVVPFIVNRKVDLPGPEELRNYDAAFHATRVAGLPANAATVAPGTT